MVVLSILFLPNKITKSSVDKINNKNRTVIYILYSKFPQQNTGIDRICNMTVVMFYKPLHSSAAFAVRYFHINVLKTILFLM